ncbi:CBS domain-containing protein [Priestia megaterium]
MSIELDQKEHIIRFEAAFNRIHHKLKELAAGSADHMSYSEALYAGRKLHNVVRSHYSLLKQFGYLRNSLVHHKYNWNDYIAYPHENTVKKIESICERLMKPPLSLSIASQSVVIFAPDTPLKVILKELEHKEFSQFPIYENNKFIGLLTEGGITKWLSLNLAGSFLSIEGVTAKDILTYEKKHNVSFLHKDSTIYDLEDVFEEAFDQNEKLEAVLITQNGSKTQKPIGIVTSWDLVQIDHTTVSLASQV